MLDSQFELACRDRLQHILGAGFDLFASGRIVPQTWAREKKRALLCKNKRIEWRHGSTGAAKQHHVSARPEHVQALFEGRFTHRVVHYIDAFIVSDLLRLCFEVSLRV